MTPAHFKNMDFYLAQIEKCLNMVGYVPILSQYSGAVRETASKVMIIASIAIILANYGIQQSQDQAPKKIFNSSAIPYVIHGLANYVRARLEINNSLLGLLIRLSYDHFFPGRIRYPGEQRK